MVDAEWVKVELLTHCSSPAFVFGALLSPSSASTHSKTRDVKINLH